MGIADLFYKTLEGCVGSGCWVAAGWPSERRRFAALRSLPEGAACCAAGALPVPTAHPTLFTLHQTERLSVPSPVREDYSRCPFCGVPRLRNGTSGEDMVFPLVKTKTVAVATHGC